MNAIHATVAEINKLSLSEKILIVEEIWDNLFKDNEYLQLTEPQEAELNRRIDFYHANPQQGRIWDEIKANFWQRQNG